MNNCKYYRQMFVVLIVVAFNFSSLAQSSGNADSLHSGTHASSTSAAGTDSLNTPTVAPGLVSNQSNATTETGNHLSTDTGRALMDSGMGANGANDMDDDGGNWGWLGLLGLLGFLGLRNKERTGDNLSRRESNAHR